MSNGNVRFNFDTAVNLTNKLTNCMDILEIEHENLQNNFSALQSDFKDAFYGEFQTEFQKGERIIKTLTQDVRNLTISMCKYAVALSDYETGGNT